MSGWGGAVGSPGLASPLARRGGLQGTIEVRDEVVDRLDPDRQPDDVRPGARRDPLARRTAGGASSTPDGGSGSGCRRRWRGATTARRDSTSRTPASKPPLRPNVNTEPGAARQVLRPRARGDGLDGRPAYETQATAGCAVQERGDARARSRRGAPCAAAASRCPVRMWNALVGDSAGPEVAQRHRARLHREPEVAEGLDGSRARGTPGRGRSGTGTCRSPPSRTGRTRRRCRPSTCRGRTGTWSASG